MNLKSIIIGLFVLLGGLLVIYLGEPWAASHTSQDEWRAMGSSPAGLAWLYLIIILGLVGFAAARTGKRNEGRVGALWSAVTLTLVLVEYGFASESIRQRIPIPDRPMSWDGLFILAFYLLAPMGGASIARDDRRKGKPDPTEQGVETLGDAVDVASDISKFFH